MRGKGWRLDHDGGVVRAPPRVVSSTAAVEGERRRAIRGGRLSLSLPAAVHSGLPHGPRQRLASQTGACPGGRVRRWARASGRGRRTEEKQRRADSERDTPAAPFALPSTPRPHSRRIGDAFRSLTKPGCTTSPSSLHPWQARGRSLGARAAWAALCTHNRRGRGEKRKTPLSPALLSQARSTPPSWL